MAQNMIVWLDSTQLMKLREFLNRVVIEGKEVEAFTGIMKELKMALPTMKERVELNEV